MGDTGGSKFGRADVVRAGIAACACRDGKRLGVGTGAGVKEF